MRPVTIDEDGFRVGHGDKATGFMRGNRGVSFILFLFCAKEGEKIEQVGEVDLGNCGGTIKN